jgi:hypothetical protein
MLLFVRLLLFVWHTGIPPVALSCGPGDVVAETILSKKGLAPEKPPSFKRASRTATANIT